MMITAGFFNKLLGGAKGERGTPSVREASEPRGMTVCAPGRRDAQAEGLCYSSASTSTGSEKPVRRASR